MSQWQRQTVASLKEQINSMAQVNLKAGNDGFDREFESLRMLDREVRNNHDEFYSAMLGSNSTKNRFTDVLPNEGTRVSLHPINSRGDGEYINANYIDARRLFGLPFVYIATQAPMRNTVFDFWRMVFEHNCRFIVMLCNTIEAGKVKSERYWPESVGVSFRVGTFTVTLINENVYEESIFRVIRLQNEDGSDARDIYHLQHISWPDMSVPRTTNAIHDIIAALGQHEESAKFPIVVHCSGGIGRTGVFITIHILLGLFEKEFPISVPGVISLLKRCRSGMVDRKDQFHFAYYGAYREMTRMISSKARALASAPRDAQRATSRAMPFGQGGGLASRTGGGGGYGGEMPEPRASMYEPKHPAQMQPMFDTVPAFEPVTMYQDENRHIQYHNNVNHNRSISRGGGNNNNNNPYMQQQHQGGFNYNNDNNTYDNPGAIDTELARMRNLNRAKRGSETHQTITSTYNRGGGGQGVAVPMQQPLSPNYSNNNNNGGGGINNGVTSPQPRQPNKYDTL